MTTGRVHLHPRRAKPLYARHPWVYPAAIASVEGDPADGDEVDVHAHGGAFVARGLYNSRSRLRVRLYSWEPDQPLDQAFFHNRIAEAIRLRRDVLGWVGPHRACRLIFSEGDGLSGLTVDLYDRWLVVQFTSLALAMRREMFADILSELLNPAGIYLRTERGVGKLEGLEIQDGLLQGEPPSGPILIREPGPMAGIEVEFLVDVAEGQKTGFYLDQRENRLAVARYAAGRRVLDAFCYSGGFGLACLRGGAEAVIGVDSSEAAVKLARLNAARNGFSEQQAAYHRADVFEFMQEAVRHRERFGVVVLDPPKFARTKSAVEDALRGYRRLLTLAHLLLAPEGILVLCCCSGLITMEMLEELSGQVAASAKRTVQLLERRGQPPDHPVVISCLESAYLKCLIQRIL
ncbi:MAG: class I SAM-dependent rRNA methyltransferase [Gemmatales bacterium]|nr:class I SAM-dependent rRNA methyltransferase [Gemmatales bacterium]MDW8385656.1 class I SAM-dependent rRNA methyltransferase [Gemmatales bacterium]